ncbi:MAG: DUF1805 domain-containing protein [Planctomycetota bacterium]
MPDLTNVTTVEHRLNRPLLVITAPRGSLCCGYLSVDALERNGDAAAIVTGVSDVDDMLAASVKSVTSAAEALGVSVGMSGRDALAKFGGAS